MNSKLKYLVGLGALLLVVFMMVDRSLGQEQPPQPPAPIQWEYLTEESGYPNSTFLNRHGKEGWELVTINQIESGHPYLCVFKRAKR